MIEPQTHHPPSRSFAAPPVIRRLGFLGLAVGVAGAILLVLGALTQPEQFFRSYLAGYVPWIMAALGSLGFLMIQHLSGGDWGVMARRIFEAASRTLPVMALLFIPIGLGIAELYPWAQPAEVETDYLLQHREPFLNPTFWIGRAVLYFAVWSVLAYLLSSFSKRQDQTGDPALIGKMKTVSGPGMVLIMITATFAAFDWLMALDAHWYSTIYGVWFVGGCGLAAMAFNILMAQFLGSREPMIHAYQRRHFHDWGKLLLALTMLWAYFSLSQFLIIWSGNVPEFTVWYLKRLSGGWEVVALGLVLLQFALPFLLLLSKDLKRDGKLLAGVAVLILLMRWVDVYWNVMPVFAPELGGDSWGHEFTFHWLDPVAWLAIGGLWLWLFARNLAARPLLPINDPYLEEALADGGHH